MLMAAGRPAGHQRAPGHSEPRRSIHSQAPDSALSPQPQSTTAAQKHLTGDRRGVVLIPNSESWRSLQAAARVVQGKC